MALNKLKKIFIDDEDLPTMSEEEYYNVSEKEALNEADKTGNKMILLEPRAYSESQQIADHLKNRNSVVVNLKRVTSAQAKRIIDFLSGCVYSIGGTMQKIGVGIYLCTPKNVNVQGKISDETEKNKAESASAVPESTFRYVTTASPLLIFFLIIMLRTLDQLIKHHGDGAQNNNGSDYHIELEHLRAVDNQIP